MLKIKAMKQKTYYDELMFGPRPITSLKVSWFTKWIVNRFLRPPKD